MEKKLIQMVNQIVIFLGISILFPLTVYYGFELVFPSPSPIRAVHPRHWAEKPETEEKMKEEVATYKKRLEGWQKTIQSLSRYYFYTAVTLGVLAIIAGALIKVGFVGAGFILGGVFTLISGYIRY